MFFIHSLRSLAYASYASATNRPMEKVAVGWINVGNALDPATLVSARSVAVHDRPRTHPNAAISYQAGSASPTLLSGPRLQHLWGHGKNTMPEKREVPGPKSCVRDELRDREMVPVDEWTVL